jgi:hypothetical protein
MMKLLHEWGDWEIKENDGGGEFNYIYERMCPLPQQIPIAETSKAST